MPGASELYVKARGALLDALEALEGHREAVVLVGAQAIYLYTGEADVPIATQTKDSDIALNPRLIEDDPLLELAMARAGFHRNIESGQPGEWLTADGVPVDLLVPRSMVPAAGSRGARIPPHSKHSARKVVGLEAAIVDFRSMQIGALDEEDPRSFAVNVASPAALVVAKVFKIAERKDFPGRLLDKDAHDVYRLIRAIDTDEVIAGYRRLLQEEASAAVAEESLTHLRQLFGTPDSLGSRMAGRTEEGVGEPAEVSEAVSVLVGDLLAGVERVI